LLSLIYVSYIQQWAVVNCITVLV